MSISGEELRQGRLYADLTQAELATMLGISPRTMVNWETQGVPERRVPRVMKILGTAMQAAKDYEEFASSGYPGASDDEGRHDVPEPLSWQESMGLPGPALTPDQRRSHVLAPFSDSDLLAELRSRALRRGDRATTWDAERMDRYQQYITPKWETGGEDPGISEQAAPGGLES